MLKTRAGWRPLRGLKLWCQGGKEGSVEVKVAVYGDVGRKAWVCARRAEQVESEDCLRDETVSLLGGKVGVARGESSAKMILECANRTFGGVAVMCIWRDKLEVDILLAEGFLRGTGALVVDDVECGSRTVLLEVFVTRFTGFGDLQGFPDLEKLGVDGVSVVVVEDEGILVSA